MTLTKRNAGFYLICALLFCGLCALGFWQLGRLHWKTELLARLDYQFSQGAVDLPPQHSEFNRSAWEGRRVRLSGRYDTAHSYYLQSKVLNGQIGDYIITPFLRDDGSVILVNRGWVEQSRRDFATPGQPVTLDGVIHYAHATKPAFIPATLNDKTGRPVLFWVDLTAILRDCCHDKNDYEFYIDLLKNDARYANTRQADALPDMPVPVGGVPDLPNNHLQYAITWFALAAITAVMSVLYARKNQHS